MGNEKILHNVELVVIKLLDAVVTTSETLHSSSSMWYTLYYKTCNALIALEQQSPDSANAMLPDRIELSCK